MVDSVHLVLFPRKTAVERKIAVLVMPVGCRWDGRWVPIVVVIEKGPDRGTQEEAWRAVLVKATKVVLPK